MEQVIKVLLSFCKVYCGKNSPSEKEIAAVLSRLERERIIASRHEVLYYQLWDFLTMVLAQRDMTAQDVAERRVWGMILGTLKAAREEKKLQLRLRPDPEIFPGDSLDLGGPRKPGDSLSCRNPEDGSSIQAAAPALPLAPAPASADPLRSAAIKMAPATPTVPASGATPQMSITAEECEGGVSQHPLSSPSIISQQTPETPPPYQQESLYPSLRNVSGAEPEKPVPTHQGADYPRQCHPASMRGRCSPAPPGEGLHRKRR
ncbi:uncharacterized protein LOC110390137 [Numida meleagris]|uniref:uncharacterized protein LOC110390137 n=1 Tax=Numida meleagris TaxID=8996 RepID=UPI000B3DB292|nr:uncharacterized protein LOC110390137 [Numida meleagris]